MASSLNVVSVLRNEISESASIVSDSRPASRPFFHSKRLMTPSWFSSKFSKTSAMPAYEKLSFSSASRNSSRSMVPESSVSIASKSSAASTAVNGWMSPFTPSANGIPSLLSTQFPATVASSPSNGVKLMEMMTLAISNLATSNGSTPNCCASWNSTNANSPPPASVNATRMAWPGVNPNDGPDAKMMPVLAARNAAMPTSNVGHCSMTICGSKLAPAVRKKMPNKMPSNG
mmetsp:Transcript_19574/g.55264  ORF Transcript_19574/g.55264 Transcript_19574/m.55264 type:complete len:231 (+) Transcript_19574:902-1594(+)